LGLSGEAYISLCCLLGLYFSFLRHCLEDHPTFPFSRVVSHPLLKLLALNKHLPLFVWEEKLLLPGLNPELGREVEASQW
jgi:hypothetical protein